jgi:hypothetical protein
MYASARPAAPSQNYLLAAGEAAGPVLAAGLGC